MARLSARVKSKREKVLYEKKSPEKGKSKGKSIESETGENKGIFGWIKKVFSGWMTTSDGPIEASIEDKQIILDQSLSVESINKGECEEVYKELSEFFKKKGCDLLTKEEYEMVERMIRENNKKSYANIIIEKSSPCFFKEAAVSRMITFGRKDEINMPENRAKRVIKSEKRRKNIFNGTFVTEYDPEDEVEKKKTKEGTAPIIEEIKRNNEKKIIDKSSVPVFKAFEMPKISPPPGDMLPFNNMDSSKRQEDTLNLFKNTTKTSAFFQPPKIDGNRIQNGFGPNIKKPIKVPCLPEEFLAKSEAPTNKGTLTYDKEEVKKTSIFSNYKSSTESSQDIKAPSSETSAETTQTSNVSSEVKKPFFDLSAKPVGSVPSFKPSNNKEPIFKLSDTQTASNGITETKKPLFNIPEVKAQSILGQKPNVFPSSDISKSSSPSFDAISKGSIFGQSVPTSTRPLKNFSFGQPSNNDSVNTNKSSIFDQNNSESEHTSKRSTFENQTKEPNKGFTFGQPASTSSTTNMSINPQTNNNTSSIFGQSTSTNSFNPPTNTSTSSIFGQPTNTSSSPNNVNNQSSIFSQPTNTNSFSPSTNVSTNSIFGQSTNTNSSTNPSTNNANHQSSIFGQQKPSFFQVPEQPNTTNFSNAQDGLNKPFSLGGTPTEFKLGTEKRKPNSKRHK
eukprot:GHVP01060684.1.p1 GENE.GHVP01060684.1~~GHVP01060684.1.p1  ORF type:complete len:675 (+),score=138.59 GHVP01060684.1:16-2040(+)